MGPFVFTLNALSQPYTSPIIAQGGLAGNSPYDVCSDLTPGSLDAKIGVMKWSEPPCSFSTVRIDRMVAAGSIASIIVDLDNLSGSFSGSSSQVNGSISETDGDILIAALESNPGIILTIIDLPVNTQKFNNITRSNEITFDDIDSNFVIPNENLNSLLWKAGDEILYDNNGGINIPGLVNGQVYYAIVYTDGFSERALVKDNNVTNCSVSGYQDDKKTYTSSAWLSNTGYSNGPNGKNNYQINWSCKAPVAKGDLSCYPKPKYYTENISISPCNCGHKNKSQKSHKKK